jgi:hypothetical protein
MQILKVIKLLCPMHFVYLYAGAGKACARQDNSNGLFSSLEIEILFTSLAKVGALNPMGSESHRKHVNATYDVESLRRKGRVDQGTCSVNLLSKFT